MKDTVKKILAGTVSAFILFSFVACGGTGSVGESGNGSPDAILSDAWISESGSESEEVENGGTWTDVYKPDK